MTDYTKEEEIASINNYELFIIESFLFWHERSALQSVAVQAVDCQRR